MSLKKKVIYQNQVSKGKQLKIKHSGQEIIDQIIYTAVKKLERNINS